MVDIVTILDIVTQGGLVGLLLLIIFGIVREWWVPGPLHRRLLAESHAREQEWKKMALEGTAIADKAVGLVSNVRS
jgi:hypothetical protein